MLPAPPCRCQPGRQAHEPPSGLIPGARGSRLLGMREPSHIRRILAVFTALVTLLPGPLLTLTEAHEGYQRVSVEAEHDAEHCSVVHHHMACIQHASSAPHPVAVRFEAAPTPVRHRASGAASEEGAGPAPLFLSLPRAPPFHG